MNPEEIRREAIHRALEASVAPGADIELSYEEAEKLIEDPPGQFLKTRAFRAAQIARDLLAAAQALGLDTERYHELVACTTDVNAHFNPAVRIQHGQ